MKRFVEKEGGAYEFTVDSMPERFIEPMVMQGMKVDSIERGRIVCSFTVPPRLVVRIWGNKNPNFSIACFDCQLLLIYRLVVVAP